MQQMNFFELLYPKFKFTKPIRLVEFFAGYGSQSLDSSQCAYEDIRDDDVGKGKNEEEEIQEGKEKE